MFAGKATGRIDWRTERDTIDVAAIATRYLGPAPGRSGERGRRLWWNCPFHDDKNPSFSIDPGKPWWKCWGCDAHGDAATLVMRMEGVSFPEAIARLTCESPFGLTDRAPEKRDAGPRPADSPAAPSGLPEADALAIVTEAEDGLWTPEGAEALVHLTQARGLTLETIRRARLGWTSGVRIPTKAGKTFDARGVVLPWFDGGRLALVKIRQPETDRPKYAEAFRNRTTIYPDRRVIRTGRPLVIVEGEFDALLLGQELDELAAVVTLGGTGSSKPDPLVLETMLAAEPWFIALDGDDAGEKAAARWDWTKARRVRPPEGKDWGEVRRAGVNLRRWWADYLGIPFPHYSWDHLSSMRWGLAAADLEPGILIDRAP